jgi:hypothetical protein
VPAVSNEREVERSFSVVSYICKGFRQRFGFDALKERLVPAQDGLVAVPYNRSCGDISRGVIKVNSMQDYISYAEKNGITISTEGPCQFCGSNVSGGVFECNSNLHRLSTLLDFNNPKHYEARFLSVDAMALQHSELHGPWNNHIHLTRLFLIFERHITWNYSKTPQLSIIINTYKKDKSETLPPPPLKQRGEVTTSHLLGTNDELEIIERVKSWAKSVFHAYKDHQEAISKLADRFLEKYY